MLLIANIQAVTGGVGDGGAGSVDAGV